MGTKAITAIAAITATAAITGTEKATAIAAKTMAIRWAKAMASGDRSGFRV
jgi:hypothetical protein